MKSLIIVLLFSVLIMAQDRIVIDNVSKKVTVNEQAKDLDSLSLEYLESIELSGDKVIERIVIEENKVVYEYAENGFHGFLMEFNYLPQSAKEYIEKRNTDIISK